MQRKNFEPFRSHLQDELIRRCRANSRYSLRAFARTLEVEPSFLSKILNKKRPITQTTLKKFSERLGLGPSELEALLAAPNGDSARYNRMDADQFELISEWYHYAILELLRINDFEITPRAIARALGITIHEATGALERLARLEILEIDPEGRLHNRAGSLTTVGNEFTRSGFRKLQKAILLRAIDSMENIPFEMRDQTSMTLAIDSRRLSEAKIRIRTFRRELTEFLQSSNELDQVYQFSASLYPITQIGKEKIK